MDSPYSRSEKQVNQDPNIDEQIAYYDRWNESHRHGQISEIAKEIRVLGLCVLNHLRAQSIYRPKILEIGCGTGWLTELLCDLGSVTAIDLSPRAIEIAQSRGMDAKLIAGDFFQQDFPEQSYDVGVCMETLFYVSDQSTFLKKFASYMKPGAIVGFTTINKFVYDRSSDIAAPEKGQVRHWRSKREIRKLLAPHFDILSIETLEPRGDSGILRLVNSVKINRILELIFSAQSIKQAKEKLGFGGGIVIMARRKRSS
jgi:2-polyprenyl-3-methyl-5-hydroxy-6-metoxy-1,4-benzoquinol methylase